MSVVVEHPNALEARDLRRREIEHAMRCLYRDHTWIDPDGDLPVFEWLDRIHYLRDDVLRAWFRSTRIDPFTPVGCLTKQECRLLIGQMLRFVKASA